YKRVKQVGCLVINSATTVAEARWLEDEGEDAVIAQGFRGGRAPRDVSHPKPRHSDRHGWVLAPGCGCRQGTGHRGRQRCRCAWDCCSPCARGFWRPARHCLPALPGIKNHPAPPRCPTRGTTTRRR